MIPERIGRFRVERALGAGTFATVWLARDEWLDELVAVKVLADNWARDPDVHHRFVEEARILRRLDDDHVVRVHMVDELPSGQPYFAMTWADRGTLAERLSAPGAGPWSPVLAVGLGLQLLECVAVLHSMGVVHRDIKPSNVLIRSTLVHHRRHVDDEERLLLGDFGLAKDLAAGGELTVAAGTPAYMAPEQARMSAIDGRADLFAVAAVMSELLTGPGIRLGDAASGPRGRIPADVSGDLRTVLERALADDPADRYPSAAEMAGALRTASPGLLNRIDSTATVIGDAPASAATAEASWLAPLSPSGRPGPAASAVPVGVVTLMFTGIEDAAHMWERFPAQMQLAHAAHDTIVRRHAEAGGGYVFKTVDDRFFVAFADAGAAVTAALAIQEALDAHQWPDPVTLRVRIGVHTGACVERGGDYFGPTVNRASRLEEAAQGGQTVLSAAARAALGADDLAGIVLRDLGEHRFKDLDAAEQVFQVEDPSRPGDFEPLRSLTAEQVGRLPEVLDTFVGRDEELADLVSSLGTARVVTVIGPGGVGKTRLAIEAAARVSGGFVDGAWLCELAPLPEGATPDTVAASMAVDLGMRLGSTDSLVRTLCERLGDERRLVIMDNCEHLIDAAATVAATLVRDRAAVVVLATSRTPLAIAGEQVVNLDPLPVPAISTSADATDVERSPSTQLFVDRAAHASRGWILTPARVRPVIEICRRLDGMPLAIELAAAQVRAMPVDKIAARLHDRFTALGAGRRDATANHRTLWATIDWSYQLLTADQRQTLRMLSIFDGPFDLESVEALLDGVIDSDPLGVLLDLVDQSVVVANPNGYRILETITQFARQQLDTAGERDEAWAHLLRWANLVAPGDFYELTVDQRARISFHYDTFRALFAWGAGTNRDIAVIASRLYGYWAWSDRYVEGLAVLGEYLGSFADDDLGPDLMARLGGLHGLSGDLDAADGYNRRAEALARERGQYDLVVRATYNRSYDLLSAGQLRDAEATAADALSCLHHLPLDSYWHSTVRGPAVLVAVYQGRFDRARELLAEQAEALTHIDDPLEDVSWIYYSAFVDLYEGHVDESVTGFRRTSFEEYHLYRLDVSTRLILAACWAGDLAEATRLDQAFRPELRNNESGEVVAAGYYALGILGLHRGDPTAAVADFQAGLRGAATSYQVAYPVLFEGLALGLDQIGEATRATALAQAAATLRSDQQSPRLPLDAKLLGDHLVEVTERTCLHPYPDVEAALRDALSITLPPTEV